MNIQLLDTGIASALHNMRIDTDLLNQLSPSQIPILHLYDWSHPCATYGYFTDPFHYLQKKEIEAQSFQLARRPTGGGIIFHLTDLAFSFLLPVNHPCFCLNTLKNYAFVNQIVASAIQPFLVEKVEPILLPSEAKPIDEASRYFCMAKPTRYDVMIGNKKVGGGAQRRTRKGYLHQGSISIAMPMPQQLIPLLKSETHVWEAMQQQSFALLSSPYTSNQLIEMKQLVKNRVIQAFFLNMNLNRSGNGS